MTRKNWHDYKNHPDFCNAIDLLESYLEGFEEDRLTWNGSAMGAQFKLKNKHGWKDEVTQNVKQLTEVKPEVIDTNVPLSNSESV